MTHSLLVIFSKLNISFLLSALFYDPASNGQGHESRGGHYDHSNGGEGPPRTAQGKVE